eukprot:m.50203 g.50203  ORF g.50203 m.50203 type:complete len:465 (-) comp7500_c0_seq1:1826-3220(-)
MLAPSTLKTREKAVGTSRWFELIVLLLLYVVQGLPFGFQVKTLPMLLRQDNVSLKNLSFVGLLSLPWALKLFWAPFVDTMFIPRIGKRKSWILPSLIVIGCACFVEALSSNLEHRLAAIFVMNLAASIGDVATDGLAVDVLVDDKTIALGNTAQVVGFKMGMLVTGGLLPWLFPSSSIWKMTFLSIQLLVCMVFFLVLVLKEERQTNACDYSNDGSSINSQNQENNGLQKNPVSNLVGVVDQEERNQMGTFQKVWKVCKSVTSAFFKPKYLPLLLLVFTYKSGEMLGDVMFKPFLIDMGVKRESVAFWSGMFGTLISAVGSLVGGIFFGELHGKRALLVIGCIRLIPQAGRFLLSWLGIEGNKRLMIGTIALESFSGGAMTIAVFSLMMAMTPHGTEVSATFYTGLTMVEVMGKSLFASVAGMLAEVLGYSGFFFLAFALSVVPIVISAFLEDNPNDKKERKDA